MKNEEGYNSKAYKSFKKHKAYTQKLEDEHSRNPIIEKEYFTCLSCGTINVVEDIKKEESENRTMRARWLPWKKFKDIANQKGMNLESTLLYLLHLHEERIRSGDRDEYDVPVAANFGNDNTKK